MKSKQYYEQRNGSILADMRAGMTREAAAQKYQISLSAIRHVCANAGLYVPLKRPSREAKKKRDEAVLSLRAEGKQYGEIAQIVGTSVTLVRTVCVKAAADSSTLKKELKNKCRDLRLQGYDNAEIAKTLHIKNGQFISDACRGIPAIKRDYSKCFGEHNQKLQKDAFVKYSEILKQHGFVNVKRGDDGNFEAKCAICGSTQSFNYNTLKAGGGLICKNCEATQRQKIVKQGQAKREQMRQIAAEKRAQVQKAKEAQREARKHPCFVCGKLTTNKKYCSHACASKAANARKDARRRAKLENALVDKDISLKRLFDRDNGKCHICGKDCDYEDFSVINGFFCAGKNYPSIDHVIPLARGGEHSWDNVRLAHCWCNTIKSDNVIGQTRDGQFYIDLLSENSRRF